MWLGSSNLKFRVRSWFNFNANSYYFLGIHFKHEKSLGKVGSYVFILKLEKKTFFLIMNYID
jgi:hypothetical protein